MWPILFSLGPVQLKTWNVMIVLAFLATGFVFWRKARDEHYEEMEVFDGFLISMVVGLLVARLGFVVTHWTEFELNIVKWIDLFTYPGLSWLFAVLGAGWALIRFAKNRKWDVFEILDFWLTALCLGQVWLWLGWWLDGTRFGLASTLPWAMHFPNVVDTHHPTQVYAAGLYGILFWFLSWLEYHYRTFEWYKTGRKSALTGFVTGSFLIGHGLIQAGLAALMPAQLQMFGWRLDYWLAGAAAVLGVIVIYVRSGRTIVPRRSADGV
jgi:phosphatidylglycerol---prolipoprotein diacylglyceryl transferase